MDGVLITEYDSPGAPVMCTKENGCQSLSQYGRVTFAKWCQLERVRMAKDWIYTWLSKGEGDDEGKIALARRGASNRRRPHHEQTNTSR